MPLGVLLGIQTQKLAPPPSNRMLRMCDLRLSLPVRKDLGLPAKPWAPGGKRNYQGPTVCQGLYRDSHKCSGF